MSKPLRAVKPGETAPRRRVKSITTAANGGDHRELLVALRSRVAKTVENPNCPPRDLAALSRRLIEINKEIEAIDAKAAEEQDGEPTADEEWEAI